MPFVTPVFRPLLVTSISSTGWAISGVGKPMPRISGLASLRAVMAIAASTLFMPRGSNTIGTLWTNKPTINSGTAPGSKPISSVPGWRIGFRRGIAVLGQRVGPTAPMTWLVLSINRIGRFDGRERLRTTIPAVPAARNGSVGVVEMDTPMGIGRSYRSVC